MVATAAVALPAEQRIIVPNVSWGTYESLLNDLLDLQSPRFTYDRGQLEIMTTSYEHERDNRLLARVVSIVSEEFGVDAWDLGQATHKREDLQQGFEPDTCFFFHNRPRVRSTLDYDPSVEVPPDLVIEVDFSRSSLSRFPIYAGFGVREVWRYRNSTVVIWKLQLGAYVASAVSELLPPLSGDVLTRFLAESATMRPIEWVRSVRAWAREQMDGASSR